MNSRLSLSKILPRSVRAAIKPALGCAALLAVTACEPPVLQSAASPTALNHEGQAGALRVPDMALFRAPTEGMFASWYTSHSLEDLARVAFDAATLRNLIVNEQQHGSGDALAAFLGRGVDRVLERYESFQLESAWLDAEVERRIIDPAIHPRTRLFDQDDLALTNAFPSPRDRFALRTLLRAEFAARTKEAATDEFARLGAQRAAASGALPWAGVAMA